MIAQINAKLFYKIDLNISYKINQKVKVIVIFSYNQGISLKFMMTNENSVSHIN
jgi:hypothetical protein